MKRLIKHLEHLSRTHEDFALTVALACIKDYPQWQLQLPTHGQVVDAIWQGVYPLFGVEPTNLEALSPEELAEFENWADNLILD